MKLEFNRDFLSLDLPEETFLNVCEAYFGWRFPPNFYKKMKKHIIDPIVNPSKQRRPMNISLSIFENGVETIKISGGYTPGNKICHPDIVCALTYGKKTFVLTKKK